MKGRDKNEQKVVQKIVNSGNINRVGELVPVIMQRKTKSNLQSTESNVFEKGKGRKE